MLRHELKMAKAIHLIKYLVNNLVSFIFQRVNPRLDGGYSCLLARLKRHFHPVLRWYPNEAFAFPNEGILSNKLIQ